MKSLPDLELKSLATKLGSDQHLAFDELARRIRDDPSSWTSQEGPIEWGSLDITRGPNVIEAEWTFLQWSRLLNEGKDPELKQRQQARIRELEGHLDQDPDSLANKYFNAVGDELRKQKCESSA